jgi:hypothetical protein
MREPVVVDANVLFVANGGPTHSISCTLACAKQLVEIQKSRRVVLDYGYEILNEYARSQPVKGQPGLGFQFWKWLLNTKSSADHCAYVTITKTEVNSYEEFPDHPGLANFDPSDRKFVAVTVAHGDLPPIMQASDSKWVGWRSSGRRWAMVSDFVKFPHTPHLAWLSPKPLREDRVLADSEVTAFLRGEVVVEEKVDGANIGISVTSNRTLSVQNRGAFLERPAPVQFQPLWSWLGNRSDQLIAELGEDLILFGEWCYAVHSIRYDKLPDWFIAFDIYDRSAGAYYAADRRNELLKKLNLYSVPRIAKGYFSLPQITQLLEDSSSAFGSSRVEGLYLRREARGWLEQRVKIVRSEFTQAISAHWSSRPLTKNVLAR